ncbi:Histidine kinase [Frankia canadensis]|uniref:Histidine kinase n=1 Tax=Frankia canadensis TaxID=1836972 RepID=A0A2I2KNJ3_9ACTN|nr:winged helix-turn-helix domain-containing protein [Frankia canadensis]SNQ47230.1 Histidine kinase [Frankia canadensis]SOU54520.1 Histidine kinase [Frankia canadensis]
MPPQTTLLPYRASRLAAAPTRPPLAAPPLGSPSLAPATRPRAAFPAQALPRVAAAPARQVAQTPPGRGVWIDRTAWLATVDGRPLDLTYLEFEVLDFFVRHPGTAHSRQGLLTSVWGHRADDESAPDLRTVDVLVTRLRRKLGPDNRYRIETIRRVGYRYRPLDADAS